MDKIHNWHNEIIGKKVVDALRKNCFKAIYMTTKEEAADYILKNVKSSDSVGFGGSATIKKLNVQDKIKQMGAKILDHSHPELSPEEKIQVERKQLISDLFLCSSNAVTLNGELVNVDGAGNRVAAMIFGPKKVIVVVGVNKICKDEETAYERIKMEAAPMNTKRLGLSTPCAATGICMDCKSEDRICRAYSVLKREPMNSDITVIIVGENLGF